MYWMALSVRLFLVAYNTVGENNNIEQNENIFENVQYEYDSGSLNIPICNQEIIDSIRHLKSNRSGGPDGICIEMYKHTLNDILPFLNLLFNEINQPSIDYPYVCLLCDENFYNIELREYNNKSDVDLFIERTHETKRL